MLKTEITLKMLQYACNLIEWLKIDEADLIVKKYCLNLSLLNDNYLVQTLSGNEYKLVKNEISIVLYVLDKIKYPERLQEIATAKQGLYGDDLRNCNKIIDKCLSSLSQEDSDEFFKLLEDSDQLLCNNNVFSKKGKITPIGKVYQFGQQNCRRCEVEQCPAKSSPHRVVWTLATPNGQ